jgi:hypothetical protein
MVRTVRIAAVFVGLAWTGLAWAQLSSSPTAAPPTERFMTVRDEGKPPQRCKLIKTWHEPNGVPVFLVQAVNTGELMTIVGSAPMPESPGVPPPKAMTTRIFHWGNDSKSPAGAPVPPATTAPAAPLPVAATTAPVVSLGRPTPLAQ